MRKQLGILSRLRLMGTGARLRHGRRDSPTYGELVGWLRPGLLAQAWTSASPLRWLTVDLGLLAQAWMVPLAAFGGSCWIQAC